MRFIDFFAGIGGFRLGMEMAGHECVGHCEIDEAANRSYIAMHKPKEGEWNGKCLTADISEYHRIERESSLSDILEDSPDKRYFLSQQTIKRLMSYQRTEIL